MAPTWDSAIDNFENYRQQSDSTSITHDQAMHMLAVARGLAQHEFLRQHDIATSHFTLSLTGDRPSGQRMVLNINYNPLTEQYDIARYDFAAGRDLWDVMMGDGPTVTARASNPDDATVLVVDMCRA